MRLIDADALMERTERQCDLGCQYPKNYKDAMCRACPAGDVKDMIEDAPTVDAKPVVRCKDCVHRILLKRLKQITGEELYKCFIYSNAHKPDFFCADGKLGEEMKR